MQLKVKESIEYLIDDQMNWPPLFLSSINCSMTFRESRQTIFVEVFVVVFFFLK